jgi:hypothetical protein
MVDLTRDFTSLFQVRAFRLLTLDFYDAENEHGPYADFLAGNDVDPSWRRRWQGRVREICESGRTIGRVHAISEPPGDYIRFCLLHGYPYNVDAGEDVRITSRNYLTHQGDFWLFDDALAARLVYDGAGQVENVEMHDDAALLAELVSIRDEALAVAVPLAQYVAEHQITRERQS